MPFAEHFMVQGQFTAGTVGSSSTIPTSVTVNTGFVPTKIELINMSAIISMTGTPPANPGANYLMYRAVWNQNFSTFTTPFTLVEGITPSALTSSITKITSNGISPYDGHAASPNQILLGPKIAGTNTSLGGALTTFTISSTATLFPGAVVLMTSNSVNTLLGGMFFTVNTVPNTTTFTIANAQWMTTPPFTSGAETFNVQLVIVPGLYVPYRTNIVNISQAGAAVVTTSVNSNLTVGQQVRLYVPSAFGMSQANFTTAVISAVSGNQVTLGGANAFGVQNGLNSSAFTAFTWANIVFPYTGAFMVPIGSGPYPNQVFYNDDNLQDATINTAFQGFTVGTGILATASSTVFGVTAGDIISYTAWRGDV